ncbi:myo-inositol-1-phosphate synthase [Kribbella sandramycini]|uniref:Myo-inositol-1-phosphate synthase n=1 Tax=Kribbella sandramycini TaxID=60450 RepID=A0A7Y4KYD8_9ACTN|nr:inositol-3-phosphate synthase [Kribbella sandramycini]MBB6567444.1 myo-inositol-1-phosphate synthase [Kribbella sandramycini]NOL39946.1 myo-inositol-1-phosphate synthase [Kribbella sandramycini]
MRPRVGVWLFGARGSVATTTVAGAAALAHGAPPAGVVTAQPAFAGAGLAPIESLVFGGHDVIDTPLAKQVERLIAGGVLPAGLNALITAELAAAERNLVVLPVAATQAEAIRRMAEDLRAFRLRNDLDHVVAINVASTEPPAEVGFTELPELRAALDAGTPLPASCAAALAAFEAGASFIDFTPSTSIRPPVIREWAVERGLPFGGQDAKTGETLVKTVLAPMFTARSLPVHAWSGTNLLGGGDGATLADPRAAESKNVSKERGLSDLLGPDVAGQVHIDYVDPLGDWKTAWDHVLFSGFLGVRMTLQFTWQGCDSALAAPLVLDLARLSALALQRGHVGSMPFLGFYFKDPVDSTEHSLTVQYDELVKWVQAC